MDWTGLATCAIIQQAIKEYCNECNKPKPRD